MNYLLWVGAASVVMFPAVFLIDGWTRPQYRPTYHAVSALSLGRRGWIQKTNFVVCGAGIVVGAIALVATLESGVLAVMVGGWGLALVMSGVFTMDPMRGYPPGTPNSTPDDVSAAHNFHDWAGLVVFALAPLTPAVSIFIVGDTGWQVYSALTAIAGIFGAGAFGHAWEQDHPRTGLVQRATIVVCWAWLGLLFYCAVG